MVKTLNIKKILSKKGDVYKILSSDKLYPIKEIYVTTVKKNVPKSWRTHINCDTILLCIKGKVEVQFNKRKKTIKDNLINFILIKRNTKFRLLSKAKKSLVMSFLKIPHKKIKSIFYEN